MHVGYVAAPFEPHIILKHLEDLSVETASLSIINEPMTRTFAMHPTS